MLHMSAPTRAQRNDPPFAPFHITETLEAQSRGGPTSDQRADNAAQARAVARAAAARTQEANYIETHRLFAQAKADTESINAKAEALGDDSERLTRLVHDLCYRDTADHFTVSADVRKRSTPFEYRQRQQNAKLQIQRLAEIVPTVASLATTATAAIANNVAIVQDVSRSRDEHTEALVRATAWNDALAVLGAQETRVRHNLDDARFAAQAARDALAAAGIQ